MKGSNFDLAPHDWATLRGLLDDALELPTPRREAWLQALDSRYEAFKPRLRALLAHDASPVAQALLHTLPKVETGQFAPPPGGHAEPALAGNVGPYRLVRLLGEGGMASVWLAERTDQLQGRRFALKLPHGAWRRAGLAERMAREREILATLEHPNIARLYDAGVDADGQPYLAIEYVEGERIDAFAARHALTVPQRLQLFLQVARAVAHAHANLVVHRDLKPSNILVTAAGEVRLLDFGIAKLLEQGVAEESALTREVGRALTPDYAAPEQIQGRAIGTAADVYALGVVLFELLSGQRPYRLARATHGSRAALEQAIVSAEPMRPSETVSDPARRRALRGDLDTIVLKALSKSPAQRYATVDALADDIRRHLAHEPVLARPEARLYRAGRFVARHRLQVGAAAAVALALLVGAGAAWWQAEQAREQRDAALRAQAAAVAQAETAREAERLAGAQTDLAGFLLADLSRGRTQQEMADQLERAVTMVREQYRDDASLRGQLLFELGERLRGLSNFARANAVFDEAEAPLRQSDNRPTLARLLCLRARDVAFDGAEGRANALLAEAEALLASSDRPVVRPIRAICRLEAAAVARLQGDMPRAVAAAEEARQLELAGGLGHTESHAETLNALARAYFQAGRYRESADTARASLSLREQLSRTRTPGAMNARSQLASSLREGGRPLDALQQHAALQAGQAGGEVATGPRVLNHATTLVALGRPAEALPMLQQLLVDAQRRNDRTEVRAITVLRAQAQTDRAAFDDARRSVEEAERLYAELRRQRRYIARAALLARARLSLAQRDAPAAAAALGEARDIVQRTGYSEDPTWRQIHDIEARLALLRGDAAAAQASAAAALAIARRQAIDADASLHVAEALLLQAQARQAAGDIAAARSDVALAARHAQLAAGADHPITRMARAWPI